MHGLWLLDRKIYATNDTALPFLWRFV